MKKVKEEKTNYIEPEFPVDAFAVIMLLGSEEFGMAILPLDFIYDSIETLTKSIKTAASEISTSADQVSIMDTVVIFPITFQKKFPLKKEYWSSTVPTYSVDTKVKAFFNVLDKPFLYNLLVTPGFFDKKGKKWYLNNTYPISIFSGEKEVEEFMFNSDQVVDIKAKSAAIYSINLPKRLNWKTGEITEMEFDFLKQSNIRS